MRVVWTSLRCWVDFISIEHNGQLFCMHTNGPTLTVWNMRMGTGLFSKTLFPSRLELRCSDAGSLGNWYTAVCSGKVESFIKPEFQTFKNTNVCWHFAV